MKSLSRILATSFLASFLLASCTTTSPPENFTIYYGTDSTLATITDSTITALLPFGVRRDSLRVDLNGYDTLVDATYPFRIDGRWITIREFTGLPIVYITAPPIESKDVYVTGTVQIDGNASYKNTFASAQFKGRGNSTWSQPKRPYKIKLTDKAPLLGMPADKEWALLANYLDKSLIRNDIAFELSARLGMNWTPRRRFVELFLNGHYEGAYMLTETVKTGSGRLPVTVMGKSDTTGSFLIEADSRRDAVTTFQSGGVWFSMKEPELPTAEQMATIQRTMQGLLSGTGYDIDTWVKWGIVQEFMRNADGVMLGSCYFYRSSVGVAAGPVWDFDLSAGAYTGNEAGGWYTSLSAFYGGQFLYNPMFRKRYREIWNQYRGEISTMAAYADSTMTRIQASTTENYRRWSNLNTVDYPGQLPNAGLVPWLTARFEWMDAQINSKDYDFVVNRPKY